MKNLVLFFFVLASVCSCEQVDKSKLEDSALGDINLKVSVENEEALSFYEKGMLLLHSFEYTDAAEQFQNAQKADPNCAMAYWGEAMTLNHPLWREQKYNQAKEVIEKLGPHKEAQLAKFKTPYEKDMFRAVCILYGPGDKKDRDVQYAQFMESLVAKYPEDLEVKAFYALSLIGSSEGGRNQELYNKGAKISENILKENPNHPGALHYMIHGYDDPDNAPKALVAANAYSKVAPDAAHALHMPSHIYVALGMWDEVISSNIASWNASHKRKVKKELTNNVLNYHAFKWQMYGHLQKNELGKAKALVEDMKKYCIEDPTPKALSHLVMMRGAYAVESNDWDDKLHEDDLDFADLPVQIYAAYQFTQAMKAFQGQDQKSISEAIAKLSSRIKESKKDLAVGSPQMCSTSYSKKPTQLHIDRASVMLDQMKAFKLKLEGHFELATKVLTKAVEKEEETSYMYGPPEIIKPSKELLAEWLSSNKDHEKAIALFKGVLERAPKRRLALEGIEKAKKSLE